MTQVVTPSNLNTPDFDIGGRVANKISLDGRLFVSAVQDNTAKTLTLTQLDGTDVVLSMAALDIFVDDLTTAYDATTNIITLKQTNGGADVVINLSELQTAAISNGIATTMSGDGSDASPLKVDVLIDPASDASLTASAAGVKLDATLLLPVELTDAFNVHIAQAGT